MITKVVAIVWGLEFGSSRVKDQNKEENTDSLLDGSSLIFARCWSERQWKKEKVRFDDHGLLVQKMPWSSKSNIPVSRHTRATFNE